MPPDDLNAVNRTAVVRLANSFDRKHKKYLDHYRKFDGVADRPFVLAMTNFEQPFSFLAAHRAIDALLLGYYVDEEEFIRDGEEGELLGSQVSSVIKANGSPLKLGLFQDASYKEISAVIYSSCASMGKVRALSSDPITPMMFQAFRWIPNSTLPHIIQLPKSRYEENLLDGLRVYHNPFADHPLDPHVLRNQHIAQTFMRDGSWETDQREGMLLTRRVSTSVETKSV